jgi:hypothetical protein
VPLESLLADQAAKMVRFTFIGDFKLGRVLVQNHTADRVSKHYFSLYLIEDSVFFLLWLMVWNELGNA